MTDRVETARRAATAGAEVAASLYGEDVGVETKGGKTDLVTRADRAAEERVVEVVREVDPDAALVAEESAADEAIPDSGPAWVVDPIDGTNNFVRGIPLWTTAVAAVEGGDPVAAAIVAPELGTTYVAGPEGTRPDGDPATVSDADDVDTMAVAPTVWWPLDRREEYATAAEEIVTRFGDLVRLRSAQITLAMVAAGSLEATFTNCTPNPWDSIAGAHLVEQAGGTVTDLDGDPWRHDSAGLVASHGPAHDEVLAAARAVADVAPDGAQ